jgi:hypothetical protein
MRRTAALLLLPTLLISSPSLAEGPMNTDDAGTLDRGGMKLEAILNRDNQERGGEMVFGFGPIDDVEIGLSYAQATDRTNDPATRLRGTGLAVKWVPIQNDTGLSLGMSLGYGNTRIDERATPQKYTEEEYAVSGLATWRFESGQVLHANLGSTRLKGQDTKDDAGTWGLGYEHPLAENLKLTAEIFGQQQTRPDKAVGLRYEIVTGLKLYGAVGRGNDRSFGNVGVAWEF